MTRGTDIWVSVAYNFFSVTRVTEKLCLTGKCESYCPGLNLGATGRRHQTELHRYIKQKTERCCSWRLVEELVPVMAMGGRCFESSHVVLKRSLKLQHGQEEKNDSSENRDLWDGYATPSLLGAGNWDIREVEPVTSTVISDWQ